MTLRCSHKYCRHPMRSVTNGHGVVGHVCDPCARNARGLCRDCPAPLPMGTRGRGSSLRCRSCSKKHFARRAKERYRANPEHARRIKRRSSRRPHVRARQKKYLAEWNRTHRSGKSDPLERLYKRVYMRAYRMDPAIADRINARRRKNARKKRLEVIARGEHKRLYPAPFGPRKKQSVAAATIPERAVLAYDAPPAPTAVVSTRVLRVESFPTHGRREAVGQDRARLQIPSAA